MATPYDLSAGTRVRALDFPRAQQVFANTSINNISSTTYTTGSPEVSVRIQAPTSGRVAVCVGAGTRNNGANQDRLFITYRVYEGDPDNNDLFLSSDLKRGVCNPATQGDDFQYHGHMTMVDGLTPGAYYFFQLQHRVTGSATADLSHRHLFVFPIP